MQTMKQIIVNEFGSPEKLILHDVPITAVSGAVLQERFIQVIEQSFSIN
jgi:hypothetical protein